MAVPSALLRWTIGTLEFREDVYDGGVITIIDDDISPRPWKRAAAIVAEHGALTAVELAAKMKRPRTSAQNYLRRAEIAGRVVRGDDGQWTACSPR